jgi:hypothetical protein
MQFHTQDDNGLTYIKTMDVLNCMDVHRLVEVVCCDKVEEPTLHLGDTKSPRKLGACQLWCTQKQMQNSSEVPKMCVSKSV